MSVKKTVSVGPRQQLVDLNGDVTNFDLNFTATSRGGEPFDVLVVDQTTLDNNANLEFKRAEGTISGNLVSDKNVYQNYFLCVKAEKPCEVDVMIETKEVAPTKSILNTTPPRAPQKPPENNMKTIVIVLLVIGGCVLAYYFYTRKSAAPSGTPVVGSATLNPIGPISTPTPPLVPFGKANSSLLERLNRLPM
jgi:hypothetical protein